MVRPLTTHLHPDNNGEPGTYEELVAEVIEILEKKDPDEEPWSLASRVADHVLDFVGVEVLGS